MPTYSYVCDACGGSFEFEQRISEKAIDKCQLCGKPNARRQIVSANFILKGGGWYSDGYGSSKSSSSNSANNASTSSTKSESASSESSSSSSSGSSSSTTSTSSTSSTGSTSTPAKPETKASATS